MKKSLLATVALMCAALTAQAVEKTVTFNFGDPAAYGYTAPEPGNTTGTALEVGQTIVESPAVITDVANGNTPVRFYINANTGVITLRLATGCAISVEAGGATITKIETTGSNNKASNITVDSGTWADDGSWTGETTKLTITRANGTVQFATMTVTYEGEAGPEDMVESYSPFDALGVLKTDFSEAVPDSGKSIINIGTENIDVIAVGGTTPKDVYYAVADGFQGWQEWNEVKWEAKKQNLQDNKPGFEPDSFKYVLGTGNPVVEIGYEAVNPEATDTIHYRALYTYYGPQDTIISGKTYKHIMPVMGLYYKFQPKKNGALKIQVWSNKGNRNTYLVSEETTLPVAYKAEGYINGQNETIEIHMTDVNGNDSIGTANAKRYLSAEEIQALHDAAKLKYDTVWVDDTHTEYSRIDSTDTAPYVIGNGNQHFWGYVTLDVEAGQTYWLFQDSSQIGFGGYEFTPATDNAISGVSDDVRHDNVIYDLYGRKASEIQMGRIMIQNGRKIMFR